jgi:hypothetical protein
VPLPLSALLTLTWLVLIWPVPLTVLIKAFLILLLIVGVRHFFLQMLLGSVQITVMGGLCFVLVRELCSSEMISETNSVVIHLLCRS